MKHITRKAAALAVALVLGLSACADLDVANLNDADSRLALATAGDVESLIAGSFRSWWLGSEHELGGGPIMGNASFMFSSWPANFGMVFYSQKPRIPITNVHTHEFYEEMVGYTWRQNYRALAAIAQGLNAIENDQAIADELGPERVRRARAYAKFVQGMAHGSIAMLYSDGWIVDETYELVDELGDAIPQATVPYQQVMDAALGYFDEAIAIAGSGDFNDDIPAAWMSRAVDEQTLIRLSHSMKARYRAAVARTPAERAAVDWDAVISDVQDGIQEPFNMQIQHLAGTWWSRMKGQFSDPVTSWGQLSYQIHGMADQSGMYQAWLADPPGDRLPDFRADHPDFPGEPVLIVTPDTRFPQGATEEEQRDNAGTHVVVGPKSWGQPGRGTFRWSYYRTTVTDFSRAAGSTPHAVPEVTMHEMRLLEAEGRLRTNDEAGAADLINVTRVAAGLNATDADGTNTSCVPKLPDESCGDLMEMLKWEKRMETKFFGLHGNSWFIEGRGWGDLYNGTPLHRPPPCGEMQLQAEPCITWGGVGGDGAAPVSVYNFPHES